jgi:uncharacterized tellurite resistance protein B-like protein
MFFEKRMTDDEERKLRVDLIVQRTVIEEQQKLISSLEASLSEATSAYKARLDYEAELHRKIDEERRKPLFQRIWRELRK